MTTHLVNTVVGEMHVAITQACHVAGVLHYSKKLKRNQKRVEKF
jgi:hypothetical protein